MMDIGILILTIAPGIFFATTGYRKTFRKDAHNGVWALFASHGMPVPLRWAVVLGELLGGLGLIFGGIVDARLQGLAAACLIPIMLGAYFMDTLPGIRAKNPTSPSAWISKCLCTPEAMLLVILASLSFMLL